MNLIGSVNIQFADSKHGETLLSFATPRTNKEAMEATKKAIADTTGHRKIETQNSPVQYAKDWQYTGWSHTKHLAYICFNEVTVKG